MLADLLRRSVSGILLGPISSTIDTSNYSTATGYSNQRKVDRCQNGVLWTLYESGEGSTVNRSIMAYSTDDGATWTISGGWADTGTSHNHNWNASLFIDLDDFAHVVYKDTFDGGIYYRRGTPNAGRTAWTWSSATLLEVYTSYNYPDVVAHREGTGWVAHVIYSLSDASFSRADYKPVTITSGGVITAGTRVISDSYTVSTPHKFPSIDFNHTGDGKTVAGDTPHLYAAWSAGSTGAGKGIRFRKATYSGGTWTWGTEREIDTTYYIPNDFYSLNCLFDGTRVIIGGFLNQSGATDLIVWDRDVADTTTTPHLLIETATTSTQLFHGSVTYDDSSNVYFFGRNADETAGTYDLVYRKWTRATTTLEAEAVIDSGVGNPYVSAKRGYSNNRIEFIYIDGTASPFSVTFGGIDTP